MGSQFPRRGTQPPNFGPCLLWPNGLPSQLLLSSCYIGVVVLIVASAADAGDDDTARGVRSMSTDRLRCSRRTREPRLEDQTRKIPRQTGTGRHRRRRTGTNLSRHSIESAQRVQTKPPRTTVAKPNEIVILGQSGVQGLPTTTTVPASKRYFLIREHVN